jgi:hypothetical protein
MKKIVLVTLALLSTNILLAFTQDGYSTNITIGSGWSTNKEYNSDNYGRMLRGSQTDNPTTEVNPPLTPATLLLLGLGGCAVGATVYRNTRKEK